MSNDQTTTYNVEVDSEISELASENNMGDTSTHHLSKLAQALTKLDLDDFRTDTKETPYLDFKYSVESKVGTVGLSQKWRNNSLTDEESADLYWWLRGAVRGMALTHWRRAPEGNFRRAMQDALYHFRVLQSSVVRSLDSYYPPLAFILPVASPNGP